MQIAAFLSDLKSLSVCSHEAAIALVQPGTSSTEVSKVATSKSEKSYEQSSQPPAPRAQHEQDLQRANELVSLHYDVKMKYLESGPDVELVRAARDVDRVIAALTQSR